MIVIPNVSSKPKGHKKIPKSGIPKARGVTSDYRTLNKHLAEITNDNTMSMLNSDSTHEVGSTDQLLHAITDEKLTARTRS